MAKKSNPFDELRALDLYRELDAIPVSADPDNANIKAQRGFGVTVGDKEYTLVCYTFTDGTRTAFREYTHNLVESEPTVIETEDDLETK